MIKDQLVTLFINGSRHLGWIFIISVHLNYTAVDAIVKFAQGKISEDPLHLEDAC